MVYFSLNGSLYAVFRRRFLLLESQRLVRLLLVQLQFVKKELLVAMGALDDLFNANQVCGSFLRGCSAGIETVIEIDEPCSGTIIVLMSLVRAQCIAPLFR